MKRSENLKKLKDLVLENCEEIEDKILEGWKEAEGYPQGMHIDVCIDIDGGKIWTAGPLSQNWATVAQWKGESLTVATCECWHVGQDGYDYNFDESLKYEDNIEELEAEYEKVEDEYFDFYDFIVNEHPEVMKKMDSDYKDSLFEEYFPQKADDQLDEFLRELDTEIENAEYIEANEEICR